MGKRDCLAIPFLVFFLLFSCSREKTPLPEGVEKEEKSAAGQSSLNGLFSFFPAAGDLEGVTPSEKFREYRDRSLFEYMDGGAEEYLSLRFSRLGVREYDTSLGSGLYLTIEVYDMGDPRDARVIYEKENSEGGNAAESKGPAIGDGSTLGGGLLAFRLDRYYVKVRFDDVGEKVNALLEKTARFVERRIKAKT